MNDQIPSAVPTKYLDEDLWWHDCRPSPMDDECDPRALEELKCRNTGVAAESEYRTGHQKDLEDAHTAFASTKSKYQAAQRDAGVKIQDLTHRVRVLVERVRCQIEQPRVVRCLDDAFETVCAELDCCEDRVCGCTVEPVEFDTEPPRKQARLVRRVRRYQHVVESAKSAFTALVDEPGSLTKRVADIETEVKAIEQLLGGEVPPDLKQVYARVLVVRRRLERRRVWNGFETYAEFLDCLCLALATWSDGVEAVAVLTGELARRTCRKANADQWCATLESDPVTEILSIVERNCGSRCEDAQQPEDDEECQDDDDPSPTDDCGHGHGQPDHGKPGKDKPGKSHHDDDCGCAHNKPRRPCGGHPGEGHHGHHHHGGHHGHGHGGPTPPDGPVPGNGDDEDQGGHGPRQDSPVT